MLLVIFFNLNLPRTHEQTVSCNLPEMLLSMSGLGQTVITLLLMMLVCSIAVMIERSYRYSVACDQSRAFVRPAACLSGIASSTKWFPLRDATARAILPKSWQVDWGLSKRPRSSSRTQK